MMSTLHDDKILGQRPRLQEACIKLHGIAQQLKADEKLPTMVELRDQLGISVQTLNDAVRELEKRNILRCVRGVGIYVASQRNRFVTGNVGFITASPRRDEYWGLVVSGIREALHQRDCHLLLIDTNTEFDRWEKVDGALLYFSQNPYSPHLQMPRPPRELPALTLLNRIPQMACIQTDDFGGTYQLTQHLLELGHRRIAYLAAAGVELSMLEERKEGYHRALQEAGIEFQSRWMRKLRVHKEWEKSPFKYTMAGEYYMRHWLEEDWRELGCTALVTQNDDAARGAMAAFAAAGMEVPRDVSVTGFDGLPAYPGMQRLTTIQVPLFDLGKYAANSLLDWLADPMKAPSDVRLPTRLIEGQTTAPPPGAVSE